MKKEKAMSLEKMNFLKCLVLNKLQNTDKLNPVTSKTLCAELNISFRLLKSIITELRNNYPIVSKETSGGGYWLAKQKKEVTMFIGMIEARKLGYEDTIKKMKKFINEGDDLDAIL